MFNPRAYDNSRPDGFSVLEVVPGLDSPPEIPRRFVPLRQTTFTGEIAGPLASLRLQQVFRFSRAECDRVLEALYRFPLPGDAAVTGVRVRFGDVEIHANLKEREQAETDYQEAKKQGRQAALLTRESPDVFTLQVAGIAPDQDVTVETDYVQMARAEGVGWSLRLPLTISPRYTRSDETGSRHAEGQPLAILRDPGHRFRLDIRLAAGSVESPTHRLTTTPDGDGVRVQLAEGEVIPDRDCVLTWRPAQEDERPALQVTLHDDTASGHVYFLTRLAPPRRKAAGTGVPREVIVLVDHSGSMEGPKWEAADWAVRKFLSELTERDAFTLGLFHNTTRWLGKSLRPATPAAVKEAVEFLEKHRDSGGTELGVALEQSLALGRVLKDASRHVLIITDAEVTDAGRILRLADDEGKKPDRRRIDVLCIDAAPNAFLASELAERGGGVSKFLTSNPQELDVTTALEETLADWSQPVLAGLRLEVSGPGVETAGRAVLPGNCIDLGDLPIGRSVWVMGRVPRGSARDLGFRVLTSDGREAVTRRVEIGSEARPGLKALFGARRVLGLEYLIGSGYDGSELREQMERLGYGASELSVDRKVYAENTRQEAGKALRKLLVREALNYGLASSETAFVAVRTEAGRPIEGTVVVANALPAGWTGAFIGGAGGMAMAAAVKCVMSPSPGTLGGYASADLMLCDSADDTSTGLGAMPPRAKARAFAGGMMAHSMKLAKTVREATGSSATVFDGQPGFSGGEAVLFDSTRSGAAALPEALRFVRLQVGFPAGVPSADTLDADLSLLLFVGDLAAPAARMRLADLVRLGGERPLNVQRLAGQPVRLVLADPAGAWATGAARLNVRLHWA